MKYAYIIMYLITTSVGLMYLNKFWHNKLLRYWFIFVVYSFLNEVVSRLILEISDGIIVIFFNNLWFILNSLFYILFFMNLVAVKWRRNLIKGLFVVFLLYLTVSAIFYKDITWDYFIDTFILGQLCVVFSVMLYYVDLLNSDRILHMGKSMFFYISIGVLIFNIGLIPVYVIVELIDYKGVFQYIILSLNIALNTCFIAGFIKSDKKFNTVKF